MESLNARRHFTEPLLDFTRQRRIGGALQIEPPARQGFLDGVLDRAVERRPRHGHLTHSLQKSANGPDVLENVTHLFFRLWVDSRVTSYRFIVTSDRSLHLFPFLGYFVDHGFLFLRSTWRTPSEFGTPHARPP